MKHSRSEIGRFRSSKIVSVPETKLSYVREKILLGVFQHLRLELFRVLYKCTAID